MSRAKLGRADYWRAYARRAGTTPAALRRAGYTVETCGIVGEADCPGFRMAEPRGPWRHWPDARAEILTLFGNVADVETDLV